MLVPAVSALLAGGVFAQSIKPPATTPRISKPGTPSPPQPLDEGVADRGPLSASLLVQEVELCVASDFDEVYAVPGDASSMMRVNGALAAIFDESEYVRTRRGEKPVVPAGTVWTIGVPAEPTSPGCTDHAPPAPGRPLPAQAPFMMPGPHRMTEGSKGPDKAASRLVDASAPRVPAESNFVSEPLSQPGENRVSLLIEAAPAVITAADRERLAREAPQQPLRAFDMSHEYYRRLKLRSIAKRYGPSSSPQAVEVANAGE